MEPVQKVKSNFSLAGFVQPSFIYSVINVKQDRQHASRKDGFFNAATVPPLLVQQGAFCLFLFTVLLICHNLDRVHVLNE